MYMFTLNYTYNYTHTYILGMRAVLCTRLDLHLSHTHNMCELAYTQVH